MAITLSDMRVKANGVACHPRTRKIAIWLISFFVAIGVLFGLIAPPLIRGKIAAALSDKLHRQVSIEQIRLNPYAMTATIRGEIARLDPQLVIDVEPVSHLLASTLTRQSVDALSVTGSTRITRVPKRNWRRRSKWSAKSLK